MYQIKLIDKNQALQMIRSYHYSNTLPTLNKYFLGFYLEQNLVGVITLGWGTRPLHTIKKLFKNLNTNDYLEIGRMCMTNDMPRNSESQMLSQLIKWIKINLSHVKLLFTWADGMLGKVGYVYQASNFLYAGYSITDMYMKNGIRIHPRQMKQLLSSLDSSNRINNVRPTMVVDLFMGTGNIILNLKCESDKFIGNDKNKLIPKLYQEILKYIYKFEELENILNKNNRFSTKESYYTFRYYWNKKYLSDIFDKDFIIETMLLLKMCSNSMVRFNPNEGYFNQGFRGLGNKKEFFANDMKNIIINGLNQLSEHLNNKKYTFTNYDFLEYKDSNSNRLLILDSPYILRKDMYDTDFTENHDKQLLKLIQNTNNDFIYFNYLYRDGVFNKGLNDIVNNKKYGIIEINDRTLAGQGRSENIKDVKEVIITNVQL